MTEPGDNRTERRDDDEVALTGEPSNPAAMRLRAEPPRVTRLSRKVLATMGMVASLGVGGALIYALQTRQGGHAPEELYSTENRPTADGVASLPSDYGVVPKLGPPLPGDLGKPILSAQERGQSVQSPDMAAAPGGARNSQQISPERQRRISAPDCASLLGV